MECRPFGIKVMLVSPGAVKSNISNNQAATFQLPSDSLYLSYLRNITERLYSSQGKGAMPTDLFAQAVVSKALRKDPPFYSVVGGKTIIYTILKWMPRMWMLNIMWRQFSKHKST
jgi:short-subunit dehydrogenase